MTRQRAPACQCWLLQKPIPKQRRFHDRQKQGVSFIEDRQEIKKILPDLDS
jgi:hypothetical protein